MPCCATVAWMRSPYPRRRTTPCGWSRPGIGLAHSRLRADRELTEQDIVAYLAHSRVTEQRASEQMQALCKYAAERQDIGRAVRLISNDEDNHLAYCHEELLRLAGAGHAEFIQRTLRATALAEIAIYRDVSTAVMRHLGRILRWSRTKSALLTAGIRAVYPYERLGGWRRMVSLRTPARHDALGGPAPSHSTFAKELASEPGRSARTRLGNFAQLDPSRSLAPEPRPARDSVGAITG